MEDATLARIAEGQYVLAGLRGRVADVRHRSRVGGRRSGELAAALTAIAEELERAESYGKDRATLAVAVADLGHEVALLRRVLEAPPLAS